VWCIRSGILIAILASAGSPIIARQDPAPQQEPKPKDQMFSGTITAIDETSLTATRRGQGKVAATKTFVITPETRFEGGRPMVNSRVTVRYISTEEGDRAIHIIVRGIVKK
jgi:hypothetical protein